MTLTHLFSPLRVGSVEFKNRIFSTGHQTGLVVVSMGHERNAGLEAALADYAGEAPPPDRRLPGATRRRGGRRRGARGGHRDLNAGWDSAFSVEAGIFRTTGTGPGAWPSQSA